MRMQVFRCPKSIFSFDDLRKGELGALELAFSLCGLVDTSQNLAVASDPPLARFRPLGTKASEPDPRARAGPELSSTSSVCVGRVPLCRPYGG